MINYNFNINEEIARWVLEIYIQEYQKNGWWIAFTNPVAGPWKKINAPNNNSVLIEIYRFAREEERPDLILVNDSYKLILIVEAKNNYERLVAHAQMSKSIRVINGMVNILEKCKNPSWGDRRDYKMFPSFLWFTKNNNDILLEDKAIQESYGKISDYNKDNIINFIISLDKKNDLITNFVYFGKIQSELIFT